MCYIIIKLANKKLTINEKSDSHFQDAGKIVE